MKRTVSILGEKVPAMHTLDLNTAPQQNIQKQIHYNIFNSLINEKWEFKRRSSSEPNFVDLCRGLVAGITQPQSRPHHSSA